MLVTKLVVSTRVICRKRYQKATPITLKKIERRAACPTLDAYINNFKPHILIDTRAEVSAISENFIKKNNKYFRNTAILPTTKLQIQTADKNKMVATGQVYITLKYNELEVNIPVIIIKKLVCNVVLGVDFLTKCQAQIELAKGCMHWIINGRKYQLQLNDNEVNKGK